MLFSSPLLQNKRMMSRRNKIKMPNRVSENLYLPDAVVSMKDDPLEQWPMFSHRFFIISSHIKKRKIPVADFFFVK